MNLKMEMFQIDDEALLAQDAIQYLYRNKKFTDFKVICRSSEFYVHKLILALHSVAFSDYFYGKEKLEVAELDIVSAGISAVKNMISYVYGEPLVFENIAHIKDTKTLADLYKINGLRDICKTRIHDFTIEETNVLLVLEMAAEYEDQVKERECFELIGRNVESVLSSEAFMKMDFERGSYILNTLRRMGSLTEAKYLQTALRWVECENDVSTEKLKKNIQTSELSRDEFTDILISFPNFFTGTEISQALKEIKSSQKTEQKATENTAEIKHVAESISCTEVKSVAESVSCTEVKSIDDSPSQQTSEISEKKSKLIISISGEEDGVKRAIVSVEDEISRRSLQFEITGDIKEGILSSLSSLENGDHVFDDVDISYEGIYFMLACLRNDSTELSSVSYIEVLKAAIFFDIEKLQDFCLMKVGNIVDYDPKFLDGLRHFRFLEDRLLFLIQLVPRRIILHPNFIHCSESLIEILLEQAVMDPSEEVQLLLVTIAWLEARNRLRWKYRSLLLSKVAFESITRSQFELVVKRYPKFFNDNEINSIFEYKKESNIAVTVESNTKDSSVLPVWYNFKSRSAVSFLTSYIAE